MIHTDEYIDIGKLQKRTNHYKQEVCFENLSECDIVLKGYISSEEFRKRIFEKVNKFCDKHGIL
jgi:pyridoxal/pyridoxine/pyridoxamine kinase